MEPYTGTCRVGSGCSLEELPGAMDDRNGLRERVKGLCVISVTR